MNEEVVERRNRQRFIARRSAEPSFWAVVDGQRLPLEDLSLEGLAVHLSAQPDAARPMQVVLQRTAGSGEIRATAQVMGFTSGEGGGQAGCRFVEFEADGGAELKRWLIEHVLAVATLPISAKEAEDIVCGRSIV